MSSLEGSLKSPLVGFSGGPGLKIRPAEAEDTCSTPGLGR